MSTDIDIILLLQNNSNAGAHLAAAAITVTAAREQVVDFIHPFFNLGLTVLIQKPHFNLKTSMFDKIDFAPYSFNVMSPLAFEVWALVTLLVVAVSFYYMRKLNIEYLFECFSKSPICHFECRSCLILGYSMKFIINDLILTFTFRLL